MEMGCKFTVVNTNKKKKTRKGITLIEIIIVLVIVGIIMVGFGNSASKQVKNASRSDVENTLNVMASNLSDAYYDLGNPAYVREEDDGAGNKMIVHDIDGFKKFLSILESEYMGVKFDKDNIDADDLLPNGFKVEIIEPLDAYEQTYKCWFVSKEGMQRYAMIVSGGDDMIVDTTNYASGNYGDDILLLIYPKTE